MIIKSENVVTRHFKEGNLVFWNIASKFKLENICVFVAN